MSTRKELLQRVEAFLARTGMTERHFGLRAVHDHRFVPRLRTGAGVTLRVIERAERFMAEYERPALVAGSRPLDCAPVSA